MISLPQLRPIKLVLLAAAFLLPTALRAQDQNPLIIKLNGDAAANRTRIAAADFKGLASGPQTDAQGAAQAAAQSAALRHTFDTVLFSDLNNAGIFDLVSKSIAPQATPGGPSEINLAQWSAAPVSASMVAFGNASVAGGRLAINGYLFDVKNTQFPQVFAKQYSEDASEASARSIAHRFADEIILRLGGTPGIAETKIYYVHGSPGAKEIWEMDYDGANQHAVTHLGGIALSPRVSPDNSRLAFMSLGNDGQKVKMYSLLLGRMLTFTTGNGAAMSPAWAPNGKELAYAAAPNNDFDIWISDLNGSLARRVTNFRGPDMSPVFNPRTGAEIAWISGRTGLPQLYIMEADGSGVTRLTDGGYVSAPSWSPNGQFVAFGWNRKYGPGAPGGQDIYIMEVATKSWVQLTNGIGQCDFPSWSPDGRHITFANSPDGRFEHMRIWTMLADGGEKHPLTPAGSDMPNWSFK